jgi:protein O-mannosyl-transferase
MRGSRKVRSKKHTKDGASKRVILLAVLLGACTLALYSPIRHHDFINYDDFDYVVKNPHITAGLNWQTVVWSLTSTEQANWHPLTWISHALDCQLFGLNAGDHHLASLALHVVNVVLLFLFLQQVTAALWPSFMTAALFAWHPFNVQSVAWVAERKNLLSTLFFLLALIAYIWYARGPRPRRLLVVTVLFVLALGSKPMAVSLPFVLMLLDYWPMRRMEGSIKPLPQFPAPQQSIRRLLQEKWLLFSLSAASCAITLVAQRSGGAMRSLVSFPLSSRLTNAAYSYSVYLWKTLWPSGFSVYYPHSGASLPFWRVSIALLVLCTISAMAWIQRSDRPYFLVGWLWFLGTLIPVIGIVQVGDQAMADRYAYLPLIGLFIAVAWGTTELFDRLQLGTAQRAAPAIVALLGISFLSFRQIGYWENSSTIWAHALQVTPGNLHVEKELTNALALQGDSDEAMPHLLNIARLDPQDATVHANLGSCYLMRGQSEDAIREFETAIALTEHDHLSGEERQARSSAQLNLGFVYAEKKNYAKALASLQGADQSNPAMIDSAMENVGRNLAANSSEAGFLRLALLLRAKGNEKDASSILEKAIQADPDFTDSRQLLSYLSSSSTLSAPFHPKN